MQGREPTEKYAASDFTDIALRAGVPQWRRSCHSRTVPIDGEERGAQLHPLGRREPVIRGVGESE
jgi:hypothetical protein